MKADYSRFRFNLNKGYTRVLQQQGRVTLDADWNEHVSIQADLDRKRLQDVIGHSGVPYGDAGFLVSIVAAESGYDLNLDPGKIYVAGHRIELNEPGSYNDQPFLPEPPAISNPGTNSRVDLVYIRVRERQVTYLEDETIREIALGGPDTTTRVQSIWQVHIKEGVSLNRCEEDTGAMMEAGTGAGLLTTMEDTTGSIEDDPCVTPAESGYRGLDNRLYRVEVHQGGTVAEGAGIKWSRYNGAIAFNVSDINVSNRILTLARLGWDQIVTISPNSWIELVSEEDELAGRPGAMLQISADAGAVNDAERQVTLKDITNISATLNAYAAAGNVKVRLWNTDEIALKDGFDNTTNTTEIILEDGIKIKMEVINSNDLFRTGDYWTFTARTITGRIEELKNSPPQGHKWHCCKLALIHWNPGGNGTGSIEDCRPLFPALTEMLQLHYAGGDGQESMPGETLSGPLMVRVSRGEHPVENVPIKFQVEQGDGKVFIEDSELLDKIVVYTNGEGFAACQWQIGSKQTYHQHVIALIDVPDDARHHQQVNFYANLSIAEKVSYIPQDGCVNIGANVKTVAEALDALCSIDASQVTYTPPEDCVNLEGTSTVGEALDALCNITAIPEDDPAFHVVGIFWQPEDTPAIHDQKIPVSQFINGLRIECDGEPDPETIKQASVFMTLELPSTPMGSLTGVQMSYILEGRVAAQEKNIFWWPSEESQTFLKRIGEVLFEGHKVFLARLFLKGSKIWLLKKPDIHLDGDVVSTPNGLTKHNLILPSGDGKQGGTFEMWFNLEIREIPIIEGIYVVGVLHPKGLIGLGTTSLEGAKIIIKDQDAIKLRLNALDLGYDHQKVIDEANMGGYIVSGTSFNPVQARHNLSESGFDQGDGFKVDVFIQKEYRTLADNIQQHWKELFNFTLNLNFPDNILNALEEGLEADNLPGIIICDDKVLQTLLQQQKGVGGPDGIIRYPFFRRV
jgi:hypothetical protein